MRRNAKTNDGPRRASSGDVLGLVVLEPPKVPRRWSEHHRKLLDLRQRLYNEKTSRTETARDEISNFSEHMADAATDTYDRDWALAALSSTQTALYEIDQALKRIYGGTYGKCEVTGKSIEAERLRAIPWTRFSTKAQAQLEAKGQGARFQLGQLGGYGTTSQIKDEDEEVDDVGLERHREAA